MTAASRGTVPGRRHRPRSVQAEPASDAVTRRGFVAAAALAALGLSLADIVSLGLPAEAAIVWGHPVSPRGVISSHFRRPERPDHDGIDFNNAYPGSGDGDTIYTVADGVVHSGTGLDQGAYGNLVVIDHGSQWRSLYLHTKFGLNAGLSVGSPVRRGQPIAQIGNTGRSYGSHLHLEIKFGASHVDPEPLVADAPLPGENPPQLFLEGKTMEAIVVAPSGVVVHLRTGGKTNFGSATEYNTFRDQVAFLRARGATDVMALPELSQVPGVSWETFNFLASYIGAPAT